MFQMNIGPGAARNLGVRNTKADLLYFCDADDLYLPSHMQTCSEAIAAMPGYSWLLTRLMRCRDR